MVSCGGPQLELLEHVVSCGELWWVVAGCGELWRVVLCANQWGSCSDLKFWSLALVGEIDSSAPLTLFLSDLFFLVMMPVMMSTIIISLGRAIRNKDSPQVVQKCFTFVSLRQPGQNVLKHGSEDGRSDLRARPKKTDVTSDQTGQTNRPTSLADQTSGQ